MSPVEEFQSPYILKLLTNLSAPPALDTFGGIKNQRRGGFILGKIFYIRVKGNLPDTELGRQSL
jgi:hypothetical protein